MEITYTIGHKQTEKRFESMQNNMLPDQFIQIDREDFDREFPESKHCNSLTLTSRTGAAEIIGGFAAAAQGILSPSAKNVALRISACDINKVSYDNTMDLINAVQSFMPNAKLIWGAGADRDMPEGAVTLTVFADVPDGCQNE